MLPLKFLILSFCVIPQALPWPDGAPCIHAAFESMNPLEAVEHQGGLQLSSPPFIIETEQACYWRNQPVKLTLRGNATHDEFKGFAIQPFVWKGTKAGRRIGQFLRLDNNGSWRQQCFRNKDSITHSHDEMKKKMIMWWKNDEDDESYVQFVATVVISLKVFWVKAVLSRPIPPCRVEQSVGSWAPPPITAPPPAGTFKIQTFHMFNQGDTSFLERSLSNQLPSFRTAPVRQPVQSFQPAPVQPAPVQPPPVQTVAPRPPPTLRPFQTVSATPAPVQFTPQPIQTRVPVTPRQPFNQFNPQRLTHIIPLPNMDNNRRTPNCRDMDQSNRCTQWINFCQTSTYMQNFCRRSCRLC